MKLFDDLHGIPLNAFDVRAMTPEEIARLQNLTYASMQQATRDNFTYLGLTANYKPRDPRPLNERFADFKARLAAAIALRAS